MNPKLKFKGVLFSMQHFYSNMRINEYVVDVIKEKDVTYGLKKYRGLMIKDKVILEI